MYLLIIIFTLLTTPIFAATIYVATDGGTGTQCTGLTDHALAGATGTACRLNHPNWVFPPRSESTTRAAAAGDTVVIDGSDQAGTGSYRIGSQNAVNGRDASVNLTQSAFCDGAYSSDCYMGVIPNNVTIVGCTASGCGCSSTIVNKVWITTCTHPRPEIWGAGNVNQLFDITSATGVTIKDLEITDHANCGYPNPVSSANCGHGTDLTSLAARDGILTESANTIIFRNLNVHGLVRDGFHGGHAGNYTYDNVRSDYNGSAGYNFDSCSANTCGVANGDTMLFENGSGASYDGCVEDYFSGPGHMVALACHDQNTTGYGDGLGSNGTSGAWTFQDCDFSHNTSDGVDLLYLNRTGNTGGTVSVKRCRLEGNVGDQVKSDNNITAEDNFIISNCAYFQNQAFSDTSITMCRGGYAIAVANNPNSGSTTAKFYNNTVTSNHDVMFGGGSAGVCAGNFTIEAKNNVLLGGADFNGGDSTAISYSDCGAFTMTFTEDYNTCTDNFQNVSPCPGAHSKNNQTVSDTFNGTIKQGTIGSTDPTTYYGSDDYITQLDLNPTSLAIGNGNTGVSGQDALDYQSFNRGVAWDMGALEYGSAVPGTCGDGTKDVGEDCDGSDLNSQTCVSQGYVSGTLACSGSCTFDYTSCAAGSGGVTKRWYGTFIGTL